MTLFALVEAEYGPGSSGVAKAVELQSEKKSASGRLEENMVDEIQGRGVVFSALCWVSSM